MKINFDVSRNDRALIFDLADRAALVAKKHGRKRFDKMNIIMDLTACHANGNPLKLKELLDADDFSFIHDVFGIERHINRNTGRLENCFSPRYSA